MGKKKKAFLETDAETSESTKTRRILKLDSGAEYNIVSEDGRYFYCGETQFRKSNPHIVEIIKVEEPEEAKEAEEVEEAVEEEGVKADGE